MVNDNKFLILKSIKNFILGLEKMLVTFPKKDYISRNLMYDEAMNLLEIIYIANYETRIDKKKDYQILSLAKINKLDFYLERAYKLGYISEKQVKKKSDELLKINKMIYMWCQNEK